MINESSPSERSGNRRQQAAVVFHNLFGRNKVLKYFG